MNPGAEITPNQPLMRLAHLKARKGEPPWFERVVLTDDQMATVICQAPGTPNERHFHSMCDEWWAILEGEITWDIEGRGVVHARRGDVVFVPRNTFHLISVVGDAPAIRLAVATPDVFTRAPKARRRRREDQNYLAWGKSA